MKNLHKLLLLITLFSLVLPSAKIQAQETQPQNALSLLEIECRSNTPDIEQPLKYAESKKRVKFGKKYFPEVAYLYNKYVIEESGDIIDNSKEAAEIICSLPPGYSQLKLEFGLDRNSKVADREDVVLFDVYVDNNLNSMDRSYVRPNEDLQLKIINIQNAQTIRLRADCINPTWWNNCPRLSFTSISVY